MALLEDVFREQVRDLSAHDDERLRALLSAMLESAHRTWPDLRIPDEVFTRFVAEHVSVEEDPVGALEERCVDDLYLACGCDLNDPAALAAFERECLACLAPAIRRIDPSPGFLDEVRQMVRVNLLVSDGVRPKRVRTYRGVGKLKSWVRVGAIRCALELRRKSRPQDSRDDEDLLDASDVSEDPELAHIKQLYRKDFVAAFSEALGALETRDRNVLRMYLVDGLNIDQIGAVYRVHRATIARWIGRSREKLLAETRTRLMKQLRIDDAQFQSLMMVVRSHLDLSMERLLKD